MKGIRVMFGTPDRRFKRGIRVVGAYLDGAHDVEDFVTRYYHKMTKAVGCLSVKIDGFMCVHRDFQNYNKTQLSDLLMKDYDLFGKGTKMKNYTVKYYYASREALAGETPYSKIYETETVEADSPEEAIELVKQWIVDNTIDGLIPAITDDMVEIYDLDEEIFGAYYDFDCIEEVGA